MITINVSDRHIQQGSKGSCIFCPIALAATEQLLQNNNELFLHIKVGQTINLYASITRLASITLPLIATKFIHTFDTSYDEIEPFSFEIDETPFLPWIKPVAITTLL